VAGKYDGPKKGLYYKKTEKVRIHLFYELKGVNNV
jgi:hypothetical protein